MRVRNTLLGATALVSFTSAASAAGAPAPDGAAAPAQPVVAAATDTAPTPAAADADAIIVTGSRLRTPNGASSVPITSVSAAEIQQTGSVSLGDTLNRIPGLANTFSQSNSTNSLGTAGLNLLDLYGLGTQRTLVLVNGRRHVASDVLNNSVSTDINTIPSDLIERIDIVTGGQSAVYGSDAIAGVVNFVLKQDFDGIQASGQGATTRHHDAGAYEGSLLLGRNFAEGRGNFAVDLEYAHQNSLYATDRSRYARRDGFVTVQVDPPGSPNGSDGVPDSIFVRDIRLAGTSMGGLFAAPSPDGACGTDSLGRPFTCNYLFQPDGTLVPQTGTRIGLAPNPVSPAGGSFLGGNGNTGREGTQFQLLPRLDRYAANWIGHFDVSSAFKPFVEGSFVRTATLGQGSNGPAFFSGTTLDRFYERPTLDNPFLGSQARALIASSLTAVAETGINPTTGGGFDSDEERDAYLASVADGSARFNLRKTLTDLGTRTEKARRDTFRVVLGARGDITGHLRYEASGNYGQFVEHTKVLGNLNTQRFLLAMDAQRDGDGRIVCGSQIDPSRAYPDFNGDDARVARDIAACVPLNPFGTGNVTQAMRNYLLSDTTSYGKLTQIDANAFVAGDTGGFLTLPGGPIGFSAGAEYRRETNYFREDPLVEAGYTFYNAIARFDPPSFEVKEGYAEVRLPLLKDRPFFRELTVGAQARVADYKGSAGTVWTYNAYGTWKPISAVGLRGSFAHAVRAPNLSELYAPVSQNFAFISDPCSEDNLAQGTTFRVANCTAAGRPDGYNFSYTQSLEVLSGGNRNLRAETSRSITAGIVLQPPVLPGFVATADVYDIRVDNVIQSVGAQTIVDQCYDLPSLANQYCGLFRRAGADGGANGEIPFQILEGNLLAAPLNYARLHVRGVNTDVSYRREFAGGRYGVFAHLIWNHSILNDGFIDPTNPQFKERYNGTLGNPKDEIQFSLAADAGPFFAQYALHYIAGMLFNDYATTRSVQGRPPTDADATDILAYPAVVYHDIRVGLKVGETSTFYVGVDNLGDTLPSLGSTGIGVGSGIYDNIGRRFYAGFSARF